jgi:hypothetical protein
MLTLTTCSPALPLPWIFLGALLLYIIFFGYNVLTRYQRFTSDSMNYVDIARNICRGYGISQTALGFNEPYFTLRDRIPIPVTSQPPLYPLLICMLSRTGLPFTQAALLIAVLGYGGTLWASALLAHDLYDLRVALVSVACLLFFHPLRIIAMSAWSETSGACLVLLSLWCVLHALSTTGPVIWFLACLAGLLAGLAFATRYAFLPAIVLCLGLLLQVQDAPRAFFCLLLCCLGFALPTTPLLLRNYLLKGKLIGTARYPSTQGPGVLLRETFRLLLGGYGCSSFQELQIVLLEGSLLLFCTLFLVSHQWMEGLQTLMLENERFVLFLWPLIYLVFVIYQRSRVHFDSIRPRLIAPAGIPLVIVWTASLIESTHWDGAWWSQIALALVGIALFREYRYWRAMPRRQLRQNIDASERLSWVARHRGKRVLFVGDDVVDLPFYFEVHAISFSPFPYTSYLDYSFLMAYLSQHRGAYDQVYLVLRKRYARASAWSYYYGPFIAWLVRGQKYPSITFLQEVKDGYIFSLSLPHHEVSDRL